MRDTGNGPKGNKKPISAIDKAGGKRGMPKPGERKATPAKTQGKSNQPAPAGRRKPEPIPPKGGERNRPQGTVANRERAQKPGERVAKGGPETRGQANRPAPRAAAAAAPVNRRAPAPKAKAAAPAPGGAKGQYANLLNQFRSQAAQYQNRAGQPPQKPGI